eukprot:TRINITY_DN43848_c0_g2_i1.p2 TRINITY_DN43848_c0_g2~~TRINITY_DN43848_c0_g2_i1.p2  ORF type:complete len:365 (+),score=124.93 TRINITY_DN43848_c0_g2_i1:103-1095(+)
MQGIDPSQLFGMMGGMGGMMGGMPSGPRRGRDVGIKMEVPLEMLYNGATKEVELPRTINCPKCKGSGSKSGKSVKCQGCRGQGQKIIRRQIGPGMIQQGMMPCDQCEGRGTNISEKDKCPKCEGRQTQDVERTLKVNILPGMKSKEQIPFPGQGDEGPDISEPGSIIVLLEQAPHEVYERKGDDLYITKTITLAQALTGFTVTHEHMDKRTLVIQSQPGLVIKPGDKQTIIGEGMPKKGQKGQKGDLIITFEIEFPRMLDEDQIAMVRQGLPPGPKVDIDFGDDEEPMECFMDDYTLQRWAEINKVTEDEEDDMEEEGPPRGQGVQCAHQ